MSGSTNEATLRKTWLFKCGDCVLTFAGWCQAGPNKSIVLLIVSFADFRFFKGCTDTDCNPSKKQNYFQRIRKPNPFPPNLYLLAPPPPPFSLLFQDVPLVPLMRVLAGCSQLEKCHFSFVPPPPLFFFRKIFLVQAQTGFQFSPN